MNVFLFVLVQFYDLCELFRTGGPVPDTNYIFMVRHDWLSRSVCLQLQVNPPVSLLHHIQEKFQTDCWTRMLKRTWSMFWRFQARLDKHKQNKKQTRLVCQVLSQVCVWFWFCRGTLWTGATIVWRLSRTCWLLKPSGPIGSRCSEETTRADR